MYKIGLDYMTWTGHPDVLSNLHHLLSSEIDLNKKYSQEIIKSLTSKG